MGFQPGSNSGQNGFLNFQMSGGDDLSGGGSGSSGKFWFCVAIIAFILWLFNI